MALFVVASPTVADSRVQLLRTLPLFAACNEKQLAFIATQVEEMDLAADRDLCREGDTGGEFFVIVSGSADVIRKGKTIDRLDPGQFFGEIALIDRGPGTRPFGPRRRCAALCFRRPSSRT